MQIKPRSWTFVLQTVCCFAFRSVADDSYEIPEITTDGKKVFFRGSAISHCPFCGKKIELERSCD